MLAAGLLLSLSAQSAGTASEDYDGTADPVNAAQRTAPSEKEILARYQVRAEDPAGLQAFTAPTVPSIERYSAAAAVAKVRTSPAGSARIGSMLQESGFKSLITISESGLAEFARRQSGSLRAIFVEGGYMSLPQLARGLPPEAISDLGAGKYVLRLPLLIRRGSALQIGADVKELRLSQTRGALIANEGTLLIRDSRVIGWNETANRPSAFKSASEFRPYIVSWAGSATYVVKSHLSSLGYDATKAAGLTISSYTNAVPEGSVWGRPTAWILDSEIRDLWDGVYTRDADDIVIRGNQFSDNIQYGIDLHDATRRAIVADNTVTKTRLKHGLIFSGKVEQSWIARNRIHENGGAGIVLDRQSRNNVVTDNLSYRNSGSGIVVSESPDNLLLGNLASGNLAHGIRIRNAAGVRVQTSSGIANGLAGFSAEAIDLAGTGRNLQTDPYERVVTATVVGGQFSGNGSGPINADEPTRLALYDLDLRTPQRALGYRLGGAILPFQIELLDILSNQKRVAVLERRDAAQGANRPVPSNTQNQK